MIKTTYFDPTRTMPNWPGNLTHNPATSGGFRTSSLSLAAGLGYGTPEISLRPLFPIPWQRLDGTLDTRVNRAETIAPIDSFATLLEGRIGNDGRSIPGRLGFVTGTTSALRMRWPLHRASTTNTSQTTPRILP